MKKIIYSIIAILILLLLWQGYMNGQKERITFGFVGALTGVDPSFGASMKNGVTIAMDEINSNGGIGGKKIDIIFEDGRCIESKTALAAAQKLISIDKVKVILGGGCSNEVMAYAPLTEKEQVLIISSGATGPSISNAGDYVFRNSINDSQTGLELAKYVYSKGFRNVGVVSDNTEYSNGFRIAFNMEFQSLGGRIVADEIVLPDATDYRSELTKLKVSGAEAYFINPNTVKTTGIIVKQIRELGISGQIFLAYQTSPDFLATAGVSAEGSIFINTPYPQNDKAQLILKKYKDRYGSESVYPYNTLAAYDSVYILKQAIESSGMDATKIKKYLYNLKDFEGTIGRYGFDHNGDIGNINLRYQKVINGKFVELK